MYIIIFQFLVTDYKLLDDIWKAILYVFQFIQLAYVLLYKCSTNIYWLNLLFPSHFLHLVHPKFPWRKMWRNKRKLLESQDKVSFKKSNQRTQPLKVYRFPETMKHTRVNQRWTFFFVFWEIRLDNWSLFIIIAAKLPLGKQ